MSITVAAMKSTALSVTTTLDGKFRLNIGHGPAVIFTPECAALLRDYLVKALATNEAPRGLRANETPSGFRAALDGWTPMPK